MADLSKEDYIDPRYKRYMKSKSGRKMIAVLRILTEGIYTRRKLEAETGFSPSEVRKLLLKALEQGFIRETQRGRIPRRRGRPKTGEFRSRTGRPSYFCALTGDGMWLIRFDPEVRDRWQEIEKAYEKIVSFTPFDSYANLLYAIRQHPLLKEFRKPYYFMDQELQLTLLNPFIYGGPREGEEENVYDELVKMMKENVRSEHIVGYYRALESAAKEINEILARHKLLMEKMQTLPEVQEYISGHK